MKKLTTLFLLLIMVMAVSLFGCNSTPKCFTGEWKYSTLVSVELHPDISQSEIDYLKEAYNASDETGIIENVFNDFVANDSFSSFYLKFTKKYTYTYDTLFEREATWAFYLLSETEGFISFDTELDDSNGNPYPSVYPNLEYDAETDTMIITMNHSLFMVTLKLVR